MKKTFFFLLTLMLCVEIFYGGDLKVTADEYFSDVTSYSVKFYTMTNGKTRTIMHNSVVDQTGSTINVAGDLGKMSGDDIIIGSRVENAANSAPAATPARTFSHGVTGFQPHRHGAEPQWSEGLLHPSNRSIRLYPSGR